MDYLKNIRETVVPEMDWETEKNISYTQLSAWMECPHRWADMYINKNKQPPSDRDWETTVSRMFFK